jgi:hypothetical protein
LVHGGTRLRRNEVPSSSCVVVLFPSSLFFFLSFVLFCLFSLCISFVFFFSLFSGRSNSSVSSSASNSSHLLVIVTATVCGSARCVTRRRYCRRSARNNGINEPMLVDAVSALLSQRYASPAPPFSVQRLTTSHRRPRRPSTPRARARWPLGPFMDVRSVARCARSLDAAAISWPMISRRPSV